MRLQQPLPASHHRRILRLALVVVVLAFYTLNWQAARAQGVIHIVQPGENLFRIGLKYGVSWVAIMNANGLASTTIYVGQQLVIPVTAPLPEETLSAPTEMAVPVATETPIPPVETAANAAAYTVRTGDTLFQIAARFGVNQAELAAANNLYNPGLIYAGQTLYIPGATTSAVTANGLHPAKQIVISISEQHLYAYEDDRLVYSFTASTGMPGADTRPGSYNVLDKIPNAYGANWNLWMPNWLGIYWAGSLENGIHALPILSNGQRLWDGYLGTPVSYGCIILGVEESQTLYNWADVGTPVYIRY